MPAWLKLMSVVVGFVCLLAPVVRADDDEDDDKPKAPKPQRIAGLIVRTDSSGMSVVRRGEGDRIVELRFDANTRIMVASGDIVRVVTDGGEVRDYPKAQDGKSSDLKVGQRVMVSHLQGVVLSMSAVTPAERHGEDEDDQSPPAVTFEVFADGDRERSSRFTGELAVVNGQKITVVRRGDSGETTGNFEINDKTKIIMESLDQTETFKGEDGERQRPARLPGKLSDLKVGQRIEVTEVNGVATDIFVPKPKGKKKPGGEGAREGGEKPREGKPGDRPREDGARRKNGDG